MPDSRCSFAHPQNKRSCSSHQPFLLPTIHLNIVGEATRAITVMPTVCPDCPRLPGAPLPLRNCDQTSHGGNHNVIAKGRYRDVLRQPMIEFQMITWQTGSTLGSPGRAQYGLQGSKDEEQGSPKGVRASRGPGRLEGQAESALPGIFPALSILGNICRAS